MMILLVSNFDVGLDFGVIRFDLVGSVKGYFVEQFGDGGIYDLIVLDMGNCLQKEVCYVIFLYFLNVMRCVSISFFYV